MIEMKSLDFKTQQQQKPHLQSHAKSNSTSVKVVSNDDYKRSNNNPHQKQVQNTIGHAFRTITVSQPQFSYFYRKVQTPFTISPEKQ